MYRKENAVPFRILLPFREMEFHFGFSADPTKRTNILPNNVQCHHASPNDTLELEVPEYGSINSIRLRMNLDGGVGQASFQPAGFSRPNSDCEGIPFTPPMNDQDTISYIDFRKHFETKEQWSTEFIRRAVVTYELSVKVMKKTAYIVNDGKGIVIPNLITIDRTEETSEDSSSNRNSFNNLGIEIISKDLEGYRDAVLGTIVFNRTTIPKTRCEEFRSVAKINDGSLYISKLDEFYIYTSISDKVNPWLSL